MRVSILGKAFLDKVAFEQGFEEQMELQNMGMGSCARWIAEIMRKDQKEVLEQSKSVEG